MKKFVFTLQSVYDYKLTVEKTQKAELSEAEAALAKLLHSLQLLEQSYERTKQERLQALTRRAPGIAAELGRYDGYFLYLRESREELAVKIAEAQDYRDECRDRLILTMKELKTYVKLYDEQYAEYMQELKIEEEKDMSDLVAFKSIFG